jgi:hypothetical protein
MSKRSKAQAQLCLQMDRDRPVRQTEHILKTKSRSIEIDRAELSTHMQHWEQHTELRVMLQTTGR